ncbi:thrombin inhibitor hemalin-like isoform X2 [Tachypleus tridentatus]|uniref:thrombin inhibitor hemalin-like isoform X2 n=1 Tax=Tachypleus tridentatus TaxID=6853 RepID=UPI003FD3C476
MNYIILVCILGLIVQIHANNCHLEPDSGLCDAYMPRFYFDPETRTCELFIYGGCGGNENNFKTEEECLDTCKASKIRKTSRQSNSCDLEPETGLCEAYIPRFYFNKETGTCEQFIYGGCGGNKNNFETIEECYDVCIVNVILQTSPRRRT